MFFLADGLRYAGTEYALTHWVHKLALIREGAGFIFPASLSANVAENKLGTF
jgi:hypothetical protein